MPDLQDGQSTEMKGSGAKPYILKNTGGVYSCTCPAWRNQSVAIETRTCKHLRKLRGDAAEEARIGGALPQRPVKQKINADGAEAEDAGPSLLLAHSWDNSADLAGWWTSEKLDGVRAYWDGKQFLSRQGNLFHAPDWFVESLPNVPLDGELWIGRKMFQRTVSIVRRQDKTDQWNQVQYVVFDAPSATGGFEDRLAFLRDALAGKQHPHAKIHEQELCKNLEWLRQELARVEALGGEGLMLREPGSKYEAGRSSSLLKIKSFHDAEAVVIGHQAGAGKHTGRLGALLVRLLSGKEFSVGTGFSDRERSAPPNIGSTITFRYQELSEGGVPRFPSYVGVRIDAADSGKTSPAKPVPPSSAPLKIEPAAAVSKDASAKSAPTSKPVPVSKPIPTSKSPNPGTPASSAKPRYFEFKSDTSNKFWEISTSGNELTTRWGRIGSAGQSKTKTFSDAAAAQHQAAKLVEEKTGEGYEEKSKEG